jgi:hypothetical protein
MFATPSEFALGQGEIGFYSEYKRESDANGERNNRTSIVRTHENTMLRTKLCGVCYSVFSRLDSTAAQLYAAGTAQIFDSLAPARASGLNLFSIRMAGERSRECIV